MPSIFQDFEESVCLDGGMRNGVLRIEALPEQPTTLKPVQRRRRLILILSGIRYGSQRSVDQRRK